MASKIKGSGRVFAKSFATKMKATFEVVESISTYPTKIPFAAAETHSLHFLTSNARGYENARERVLLPMK